MSDCTTTIDEAFDTCLKNAKQDTTKILNCNSKLSEDSINCENECSTSMLADTSTKEGCEKTKRVRDPTNNTCCIA